MVFFRPPPNFFTLQSLYKLHYTASIPIKRFSCVVYVPRSYVSRTHRNAMKRSIVHKQRRNFSFKSVATGNGTQSLAVVANALQAFLQKIDKSILKNIINIWNKINIILCIKIPDCESKYNKKIGRTLIIDRTILKTNIHVESKFRSELIVVYWNYF